jgi:hypothetical protein
LSTQFKTLFSLSIRHDYYAGICPDFDFLIPRDTQALLNNGKLLGKVRDGVLYCLYEADEGGAALRPLSGQKLRFGLNLLNPYFSNFSVVNSADKIALYRNRTSAAALDLSLPIDLVGSILGHQLKFSSGAIDVDLNGDDGTLHSESLDSSLLSEFNFELKALPEGYYQVEEDDGLTTRTTDYYYQRELLMKGVFGIVEIELAASFYSSPPEFQIDFASRDEVLKYYVVAKNYTDSEFAQLSVTDQGHVAEGRPEIIFDRVAPASFGSADIAPELLAQGDDKVNIFKSQSTLGRQQHARKNIQLRRNGDVLIAHLPAPAIDKSQADLIIHVAKP